MKIKNKYNTNINNKYNKYKDIYCCIDNNLIKINNLINNILKIPILKQI